MLSPEDSNFIYLSPNPKDFSEVHLKSQKKNPKKSSQKGTSCCSVYIYCLSALFLLLVLGSLVITIFPYPMKASCTVKWKFEESCIFVMQKIRSQILRWSDCTNYKEFGKRHIFLLKESKPNETNVIRAIHVTPSINLHSKIVIVFHGTNKTCTATAVSESVEWYLIFDHGDNYCNLRNLIEGSGYRMDHDFFELTYPNICTQYNTAMCNS